MQPEQGLAPTLNLRWTMSNALSALRAVLAIPAAFTLAADMRIATAALCVLAVITDVLDGYLARRWNEVSDLGKILDPLADKIYVGMLVVLMLAKGLLPFWLVAIVLGRDLVIFVGGIYIERRNGVVLPSNYPGKIAVLVLSTTLFLVILRADARVVDVMTWISVALLVISFALYATRARREIGKKK